MKKVLFVAMLCVCSVTFSQNFDFQGLSYSINTGDPTTVTVTGRAVGNTNLDIVIPDMATDGANVTYTVTSIGNSAFRLNQLTSVILPESLISIESQAFQQNQLTSVIFPDTVISIGNAAFQLNDLASVIIPNGVTSIASQTFNGNLLTSLTIPDNVTSIGSHAFSQNQLTNLIIPDSVNSIATNAFRSNQLTNVTIGNGISVIVAETFQDNQLTSVIIGNSVTTIQEFAFSFAIATNPGSGEHAVTFLGDTAPTIQSRSFHWIDNNNVKISNRSDITVNVPCAVVTNYTNNSSYGGFFAFSPPPETFTAPADLCFNAGIQTGLSGGSPEGGVYAGPGVTDNGDGMTYSFDPTQAGVGVHTISYDIPDTNICTAIATDVIEVLASTPATFTAPEDVCLNTTIQTNLSGGTPEVSIIATTVTLNLDYEDVFGPGSSVAGEIVFDDTGALVSTTVVLNGNANGNVAPLIDATASGATITLDFQNGPIGTIVADMPIIGASGNLNVISGSDLIIDGDNFSFVSGTGAASTDIVGTRLYAGPGVTMDANGITYSFDPATAGVGTHTIEFTYTADNGCAATASDTITVFALDTVVFSAPADLCLDAGVQTGLGNATPSGGVYSGLGVIDDGNGTTYSFDPTVAGTGVHIITYDITNANGCSVSASDTIEVFAIDDASFSYDASMYGCDVAYPTPTITGLEGGTFSAGTGLAIHPNTGEIDTATTTPGTYTVTYTTAGNCINSLSVTITFTTSCMAATAFNFDGVDDYAVATNPSVLDITTGTIEMRIKPQTKTTSQTILGYRNSTGSSTKYLFNLLGNLTGIGFWNGSSYLTIPYTFNENQWYNIAITDDDSGSTTVYVNGAAIGAFASEFGTATGADLNLYVGVDFPLNEYFKGDIGDIRIWNTVKVGGTAICTPTPSGTDLVAHYNFNQGFENSNNSSVNSVLDTSSNANNLQLTNVVLTGAASNWVNTDTTIFDTVSPTVITQDITLNLTCSSSTTITAANIDNGSFDNCGIASLTIDINTFDISMVGANTVTLSVTDFYGNESSQTAQVTVVDNIQTRLYVNQSATSDFDGTSWETGFFNLQDAIIASLSCSTITEIWVASGTYSPSALPRNNTITAGISTRDNTFHLPNGIKIYGGFNATETSIDQRDIASNPTILSGNIGNPSSSTDNTYHVVTSVLDNAETRLDGFIIEGGLTTFNDVTGLTIEGIDVRRRLGAGISNHNSSTVFANLIIRDNTADIGAGIYNKETINTSYTNIVIHNNNTVGFGIGGGMYNKAASFTATNVLIANNFSDAGPAIYNDTSSNAILTNLTVFNNTSPSTFLNGSALIANSSSTFTITNTVMYNNTRDIGLGNNSTVSGTNNYVLADPAQFGSPVGFTQLIADPFTNSADIDGLDNIFGTVDDGLLPSETGVLIDSGNTASNSQTTDITGETRNLGTAIDVGAYEYQFKLRLTPKVNLQGALLGNTNGLMRDDLRTAGYLPTTSPYPDGLTCDASVFNGGSAAARGGFLQNDIVDWIWIELRDESDNTVVVASTSALLQRDGDVVAIDGFSNIEFSIPYNSFYITLKHRNHLGVMTANTVQLDDTPTSLDFTDASNPIAFGTNAQATVMLPLLNRPTANSQESNQSNNVLALWAGNANGDTVVQYSGTSPDTPSILSNVLNDAGNFLNFPTYTVSGYNTNDIDMNGSTQYSGTAPDTPFILQNVLAHPGNFLNFSTYGIQEQLPEN